MHGQMEFRIVPIYSLHQPFYDNPRFQFFPDFTLQGILWGFAWFHLTTREFPAILKVTIPSLSGEDTAFVIVYDCCYDFDLW